MYYILFLSRTNRGYLQNIINEGIINNHALDVTSKLVYCEDYYLQYIEGEKETIEALFAITENDNRHNNIIVLSKNQIKERLYSHPLDHKHISSTVLTALGCSNLNEFCNSFLIEDENDVKPIFEKLVKGKYSSK